MRNLDDAGWVEDEWSKGQQRERASFPEKKALSALRLIANGLRVEDPASEAEKIKRRLLRQIADQEAAHFGMWIHRPFQSRDGMPLSLQIVGPEWSEARILAIAGAYEDATPELRAARAPCV